MSHHMNTGRCDKCIEIMDLFPGLNAVLRSWFTMLQAKYPEAHISCAGRGKAEQEKELAEKRTKAAFGHSAHNFNCAIDVFVLKSPLGIYDLNWFKTVLAPEIPDSLVWYGKPGSEFYELPHIELARWREMRDQGLIDPVEPIT